MAQGFESPVGEALNRSPDGLVKVARTSVEVTRLAFGAASLGGARQAPDRHRAVSTVRAAWDAGVRYFDVAPMYGLGIAETIVGLALRDVPRSAFVISTKVGRLVDADKGTKWFDFSRDGVRRSFDASLSRLGVERIDILFIHDPDDHWEQAIGEAYPVLAELRSAGVVSAIGVGVNQCGGLAKYAREADFDVFLIAGRYSLLDQSALLEALPHCQDRGISVVVGGVLNSGILADPRPGARFDYGIASADTVARARLIAEICGRHGVPIKAAAVQMPLGHPAVVSVLAGARTPEQMSEYRDLMARPIPPGLWSDLRAAGCLALDVPIPEARTLGRA